MKYGLLCYNDLNGKINIGDYVQSIAARQYLPNEIKLISREELDKFSGSEVKIILNGWYMHEPQNWPPSDSIYPLVTSFHINKPHLKKMLLPKALDFYKCNQPIGCRDYNTKEALESKGIEAFYSCCLTTTLKRSDFNKKDRKGVYFVDVMNNVPNSYASLMGLPLKYILSHIKTGNILNILKKRRFLNKIISKVRMEYDTPIEFLEHSFDAKDLSQEDRFAIAESFLEKYANAQLVVTSRIHCALPCLAFETPVIFVKYGQTSETNLLRLKGIVEHFNILDFDGDLNPKNFTIIDLDSCDLKKDIVNFGTHLSYRERLINQCEEFVKPSL